MSTADSGRPHVPVCAALRKPAEARRRQCSACAFLWTRPVYALIRVNGRLVVTMLRFISAVSPQVDGGAAFISEPKARSEDKSSDLPLEVTLQVKGEFP